MLEAYLFGIGTYIEHEAIASLTTDATEDPMSW